MLVKLQAFFYRSNHRGIPGGIRVRIPQELDVVAFWSWNLDVVVFQPWNLDVVAFCPLKKTPWNHDVATYLSPFLDVVVF